MSVDAQKLQELARRYACGHPLIPNWLAWKLAQDAEAFEDVKCEGSLRELAVEIIGDRLGASEVGRLIELARRFPDGFTDDDPTWTRQLTQIGLVRHIPETPKYQVLPPLACLYRKEGSNG
ncbi:MAG: hypothetical protein HY328_13530 [Chloroflexi bacterium]|nr:hypothetical protein [Chloroflexota bacterium]